MRHMELLLCIPMQIVICSCQSHIFKLAERQGDTVAAASPIADIKAICCNAGYHILLAVVLTVILRVTQDCALEALSL